MAKQNSNNCLCGHGICQNVIGENEKYCSPCLEEIGSEYIGTEMAIQNLDFLNSDF